MIMQFIKKCNLQFVILVKDSVDVLEDFFGELRILGLIGEGGAQLHFGRLVRKDWRVRLSHGELAKVSRTGRLHCQLRTEPRSNGVLDGSEVNVALNSYTDTDDCPPNLSV
jgi:hypothetical protein